MCFPPLTSTSLSLAWRKEDSSSVWTLATLILAGGEASGMGESVGERGGDDVGEEGSGGGKSW